MAHILSHGGTEEHLLCDYLQTKNMEAVQSSDIVAEVRGAAKTLKLQEQGTGPGLIGEHSLENLARGNLIHVRCTYTAKSKNCTKVWQKI